MRKNIASAILSEGFEAIKAATGIDPVEDPDVIASKYNAIEGVRPRLAILILAMRAPDMYVNISHAWFKMAD